MMVSHIGRCFGCFLLLLLAGKVAAATTEQPLSLREAVEQALVNNLNLRLERENTSIAEGGILIEESRFDTSLTAEVGFENNESTPIVPITGTEEQTARANGALSKRFSTGTEVELGVTNSRFEADGEAFLLNPSYGNTVNLSVTQPLLRGMGREIQTTGVAAAQNDLNAATFTVDSTAANLAAQVKQSYWELVFAWQDIEVKRLSLTLAQKLLEETEAKIAAGKLAQVELFQPQSEVARREEELIGAERAIGVADDNLKILLNSDEWFTAYRPTDIPATDPVTFEPKQILANALSSRPDLKAAEQLVQAAKLRERLAEDNLRPALNLIGSVGVGGTDESFSAAYEATVDNSETDWQVGLSLAFPIDNRAAEGALQQASANYSRARTSRQLLQLEVTKQVRSAVRDVQLALKAMDATRKTSLATQKRLEAEEAKFEAGRSTTLDVLIAQEAYSQALSQVNRTDVQYQQALAELDRIQGKIHLPPRN